MNATRWTIWIPDRLKSQNHFQHWRQRYRETKSLEVSVHIALIQAGHRKATPSTHKQHLTITRHLGPRERLWDDGNGEGGSMKQLQDAIKRLGWMIDDTPKWLQTTLEQDGAKADTRTPGEIRTAKHSRAPTQPGSHITISQNPKTTIKNVLERQTRAQESSRPARGAIKIPEVTP